MCSLGELTEQLAGATSDAEDADDAEEKEGEATSPKKAAPAPAAPAAPAAVPGRKKKVLTVAAAPAGEHGM
jgi:hypothetical protein